MREIGSEFWDVPVAERVNDLFPQHIQWFLSGRSALKSIIKEIRQCQTVAMPSWCCDSMVKPFLEQGYNVQFYPVYWRDGLIQDISLNCDVLFLIDYFGYTSSVNISGYSGIVIRDVTHSLFSASYSDADYYFGSLRKWCGVWTGGYAWTADGHDLSVNEAANLGYVELRAEAMQLKEKYLNGEGDKCYLKVFETAENSLDNIGIADAIERDVLLANRLNTDLIRKRRKTNADVLRRNFAEWLVFGDIRDTDCPMFVPIIVPDGKRDDLRTHLIKNNIYCPVHWPISEYHKLNGDTKHIYENELSLVCDQRYGEEDMNRMVTVIKNFMY